MPPSVEDPWSSLEPAEVADLLAHVSAPWWISGGWAIDLWLDRQTRSHGDFDIGCPRSRVHEIVDSLPEWGVHHAEEGRLEAVATSEIPASGTFWLRRPGTRAWDLQLMPENVRRGTWTFRRDPRITLAAGSLTWSTASGIAVLRPEVQLAYKAKDVRPKDQSDFDAVLPSLSEAAASWLSRTLRAVHASHPWIDRLPAGRSS